jgi:protein-tyrosine phosphatase
MPTDLHWVDGPWPGRLALAARPRGSDWLEDEMVAWRRDGADTVVSLLELEEERELGLACEGDAVREQGMQFRSIPIPDRQVPSSRSAFSTELDQLEGELASGRNLVVHCRQGIGRTGVVAACLMASHGIAPESALQLLSDARGVTMPETAEQRRWIEEFAEAAVPAR